MAISSCRSPLSLLLLLLALSSLVQVVLAGRATPDNPDKKMTEFFHEGTVLIPGIGRYKIGSRKRHRFRGFRGLDHSIPAAVRGRYLPGGDDTFVPNPGFEIPNPFRGLIP